MRNTTEERNDRYPLEDFRREVAEMAVNSEQDFLAFVPLAARLAALGDDSQLQRWPRLVHPFRERVEQLLVDRCCEGAWNLRHALGHHLSLAVIAAQDFHCFHMLQNDLIPPRARESLEAWADDAEHAPLDEEAVEELELFLKEFPIREDLRLVSVAVPVSMLERTVAALLAPPIATEPLSWPNLAPAFEYSQQAVNLDPPLVCVFADDGTPGDELRTSYERLDRKAEVEGIGTVIISRKLMPDWKVVIIIRKADETSAGVRSVRIGLRPARMVEDGNDREWEVDLRFLDEATQFEALKQPLVINFRTGRRLKVSSHGGETDNP